MTPRQRLIVAIVLAFSAVWLLSTVALAAPQAQAIPPAQVSVQVAAANLREGPGTGFPIAGSARSGQVLQVAACNEACDWYQLDSGAWIAAFLVEAVSAPAGDSAVLPSSAPVVAANDPAPTVQPTATSVANLREGPGTSYARIGSVQPNQALDIIGRNDAGDWYKLASGAWIAAFLVDNAPANLPVGDVGTGAQPPTAAPATLPQEGLVVETPAPTPSLSGSANVGIQSVAYDGAVFRVESDEYAVVANTGTTSQNLAGWRLNAGNLGQDFVFPSYELASGQTCRVYMDESHPESCGFSFGSGRAIWNNEGDCGVLYDASGVQVSRFRF